MSGDAALELIPLPGIPHIEAGDDLVGITLTALRNGGLALRAGDVLVLSLIHI